MLAHHRVLGREAGFGGKTFVSSCRHAAMQSCSQPATSPGKELTADRIRSLAHDPGGNPHHELDRPCRWQITTPALRDEADSVAPQNKHLAALPGVWLDR